MQHQRDAPLRELRHQVTHKRLAFEEGIDNNDPAIAPAIAPPGAPTNEIVGSMGAPSIDVFAVESGTVIVWLARDCAATGGGIVETS